ncbi:MULTISPECIES: hypothetical protein [Actinotignum]|uniref:hypothetical protein n=1 Tax=Actinotignum TaxID=1653174 RepID=UPI00254BAEA3|nr:MULTISPECIES: hypothetical protein [Actinotignum]MDE1535859.1 hypothetical protein [Actinotignum schaalii]MDK7271627.1 hypothetical protein [Actinotignum schaalii]MDY5144257.1 hypothetical protein [Actinotignum timonense]
MAGPHIKESRFWRYSLYAMPIILPLAFWASWDMITGPESRGLQIALGIGFAIFIYIDGAILFWWNAWWQNHWKTKDSRR